MAKVKIQGHASGTGVFTVTAPNSNTDRTITLPDADVTLGTDATKLPLAGGALTGNVTSNSKLTINNTTAQGALVGVYTGAFTTAGVVAESGIHLANSTASNAVMQITFGTQAPTNTKATGYIGLVNTDTGGLTKGDLIFGTRNVTTDTTPTERLRITSDGRGVSEFTHAFWANVNQTGTQAIRDSHNISSITDTAVGGTRFNFANNMPNGNYVVTDANDYDSGGWWLNSGFSTSSCTFLYHFTGTGYRDLVRLLVTGARGD